MYLDVHHLDSAPSPIEDSSSSYGKASNNEEAQEYLESACQLGYHLPSKFDKEDRALGSEEVRELFQPLLDGSSLSEPLILSLLHAILPQPFDILECTSSSWKDPSFWQEYRGIAVACPERSVLILLDSYRRKQFIIGNIASSTLSMPSIPDTWEREFVNVSLVESKDCANIILAPRYYG